jgi:small conductance mechanosensitive channel
VTGLAVVEVLRAAAESVRQDPVLAPYVLGPLDVPGVDAVRDGQVTVRSRIKTVPPRQCEVGRELCRRLRLAFTQAGIDLAPAGIQTMLSRRKP